MRVDDGARAEMHQYVRHRVTKVQVQICNKTKFGKGKVLAAMRLSNVRSDDASDPVANHHNVTRTRTRNLSRSTLEPRRKVVEAKLKLLKVLPTFASTLDAGRRTSRTYI